VSSYIPPSAAARGRLSPREIEQAVKSRQAVRPAAIFRADEWVRKVRVFVGSPGDAAAERAAAKTVADEVKRTLGGRLDIEPFLWEEHVAPHLDRPQAVVFRDMRFEEMHLFVFIFRSRLGTPSGAYDPRSGEEFGSGTLEELAMARRLCEQDPRKRVMVYFCDRDVHPASAQERRQWEELRRFRDELEAGPDQGLYRTYRETQDFVTNFAHHLRIAAEAFLPPEQNARPPSYDGFVAKLCDRIEQDRRFGHFFREGLARHPGVPQVAVIWGECDQAHDSFIDRIRALRVQAHADEHWKGAGPGITQAVVRGAEYVPWPTAGDGEQLKQDLMQGLVEAIQPRTMQLDYSAPALMTLPELHGYDVLVFKHDLDVKVWSDATADLLEWYLDEYWVGLGAPRSGPEVLVLIKIEWDRLTESSRRNMRRDLARLCESGRPGCRRVLLPELAGITGKEVKEWLAENAPGVSEERVTRLLADLFGDTRGAQPPRPMTDVEAQLRRLLDEMANRTRGHARDYQEG